MKNIIFLVVFFLTMSVFGQEPEFAKDFKLNGKVKSAETKIVVKDVEPEENLFWKNFFVQYNHSMDDTKQMGGKGILADYTNVLSEGIIKFNKQQQITEIQVFANDIMNNFMIYHLGKDGKRTHKERLNQQSEVLQKGTYIYNDKNLLVEEVYFDKDNKEEVKQRYQYNSQGKLTARYMYNGDSQVFTENISYQDSRISERILYLTTGEKYSHILYQYDSNGNLSQIDYSTPELTYVSNFIYENNQLKSEQNKSDKNVTINAEYNELGWVESAEILSEKIGVPLKIHLSYTYDNFKNWTKINAELEIGGGGLSVDILRTIEYYP